MRVTATHSGLHHLDGTVAVTDLLIVLGKWE